MYRQETHREKEEREALKVKPQVQIGREKPQVVEPVKFEQGSCEEGFFKGLASCCNVIGYLVSCCGCCKSWDEYNGNADPSQIDWDSPQ